MKNVLIGITLSLTACLALDAAASLGAASASKPFELDNVATKPEAGPAALVRNDRLGSLGAPVMIRLYGSNRAVLGKQSETELRDYRDTGTIFYLRKGSLHFEANREPLAICAENKLYVPKIAASGEVTILDRGKVLARTGSGAFEKHGQGEEACDSQAAILYLNGAGSIAGAAGGLAGAAGGAAGGVAATAGAASTAVTAGTAVAVAAGSGVAAVGSVLAGTVAGSAGTESGAGAPPFVSASAPPQ